MSQNRTARIPMRVHEGTKARWQGMADRLGYANLTAFIEGEIEDKFWPDGAPADVVALVSDGDEPSGSATEGDRTGDSVDEPENEVTPGESEASMKASPASPVHPEGGGRIATSAPLGAVCAHGVSKGRFCRDCKGVVKL